MIQQNTNQSQSEQDGNDNGNGSGEAKATAQDAEAAAAAGEHALHREEEQASTYAVASSDDSLAMRGNRHVVNTWWVSIAFFLVNVSFNTAQSFATSVDPVLGSTSLSLLYLGWILSLLFMASKVTMLLGCKYTMFVCGLIYCGYIIASIKIVDWVYLLSAITLGVAAGPFWVSEGLFVQLCANVFEMESHFDMNSKFGYFNGIFTFGYLMSKFVGSLAAAIIFELAGDNTILYTILAAVNVIGALIFLLIDRNLRKEDIETINAKVEFEILRQGLRMAARSEDGPLREPGTEQEKCQTVSRRLALPRPTPKAETTTDAKDHAPGTETDTDPDADTEKQQQTGKAAQQEAGAESATATDDNGATTDAAGEQAAVVIVTVDDAPEEADSESGNKEDSHSRSNASDVTVISIPSSNDSCIRTDGDDVAEGAGYDRQDSVNPSAFAMPKRDTSLRRILDIVLDPSFKYLMAVGIEWGVMTAWIASDFSALMVSNTLKFYILAIEGFVGGVMSMLIGHYADKIGSLLIFVACNLSLLVAFVFLYFWEIDQTRIEIWAILAVLIGIGDAGYYTAVPHMFPTLLGSRSEVFAVMRCLLAMGLCATFFYYTYFGYYTRLTINIVLCLIGCLCVFMPKHIRSKLLTH